MILGDVLESIRPVGPCRILVELDCRIVQREQAKAGDKEALSNLGYLLHDLGELETAAGLGTRSERPYRTSWLSPLGLICLRETWRPITCTYSGSRSFPVAGTVPVLVLNNWVPDPSDSRNFLLAGFVNSNVAATLGIPVESVCRHSNGDVTRGNGPRNIDVRLSVEYDDPNVKVDSAGSEIRGDGRQTGERNASGSWFLKAVRVR